jgi:hypothetical protein
MGSLPPNRAGPARHRTTLLGILTVLGMAAGPAGCRPVMLHGGGSGPTIDGTGPPGTGTAKVAETCRVNVSNETSVPLDVTYTVQTSDIAARHGSLGRMERGDTRSTNVQCGETVNAWGRGGGRSIRGGVVARKLDDNWIHLTESGSP